MEHVHVHVYMYVDVDAEGPTGPTEGFCREVYLNTGCIKTQKPSTRSKKKSKRKMANTWESKKLGVWAETRALSANKKKSPGSDSATEEQRKRSEECGTLAREPQPQPRTGTSSTSVLQHRSERRNNSVGRPAFNGEEVREFLVRQFETHSQCSKLFRSNESLDWNIAQSKTSRAKKYGCLSELERALARCT